MIVIITDVELTTDILHAIADLSGTIDFDDFTDKAIITPPSSDRKTSSVRKFNVTSIADTTTYIPESSFSTLQSNKRVILHNYAVKCFEKICTTTPSKNLGKNVFIKSIFILLFFNF